MARRWKCVPLSPGTASTLETSSSLRDGERARDAGMDSGFQPSRALPWREDEGLHPPRHPSSTGGESTAQPCAVGNTTLQRSPYNPQLINAPTPRRLAFRQQTTTAVGGFTQYTPRRGRSTSPPAYQPDRRRPPCLGQAHMSLSPSPVLRFSCLPFLPVGIPRG